MCGVGGHEKASLVLTFKNHSIRVPVRAFLISLSVAQLHSMMIYGHFVQPIKPGYVRVI